MQLKQVKLGQRGYSITEIMVVITVMVILAAISGQSYYKYQIKQRVLTMISTAQDAKQSVEHYYSQTGTTTTCDQGTAITPFTTIPNPNPYVTSVLWNHNCMIEIYSNMTNLAPHLTGYLSVILCPRLTSDNSNVIWSCGFYDSAYTGTPANSPWLNYLPNDCRNYFYMTGDTLSALCGH